MRTEPTQRLEVDSCVGELGLDGEDPPHFDHKVLRILVEDLVMSDEGQRPVPQPAGGTKKRRPTGSSSSTSACGVLCARKYSVTTLRSSGSSAPRYPTIARFANGSMRFLMTSCSAARASERQLRCSQTRLYVERMNSRR